MTKATRSVQKRHKKNKYIKAAKGFLGRTNCYKIARNRYERSLRHAYVGRKNNKREFRSLWIQRINAACRLMGTNYSKFIYSLRQQKTLPMHQANLKSLALLAVDNFTAFKTLMKSK